MSPVDVIEDSIAKPVEELGAMPIGEEVNDSRVELPRTHWVEVRDAWDITERERSQILAETAASVNANRSARRANAGLAGTAPQKKAALDEDDADEIAAVLKSRENGCVLLARFVLAWGGPKLDGKPTTAETINELPVPLYNAITDAVQPQLLEVYPGLRRRGADSPNS